MGKGLVFFYGRFLFLGAKFGRSIRFFFAALEGNQSLEELDVSNNGFTDESFIFLCNGLGNVSVSSVLFIICVYSTTTLASCFLLLIALSHT
jgi:hypothetical protein